MALFSTKNEIILIFSSKLQLLGTFDNTRVQFFNNLIRRQSQFTYQRSIVYKCINGFFSLCITSVKKGNQNAVKKQDVLRCQRTFLCKFSSVNSLKPKIGTKGTHAHLKECNTIWLSLPGDDGLMYKIFYFCFQFYRYISGYFSTPKIRILKIYTHDFWKNNLCHWTIFGQIGLLIFDLQYSR